MRPIVIFEWVATLLSIAGSFLLAYQGESQTTRFIAFGCYFGANVILVPLFIIKKLYGVMTMNIAYFVISIVGLVKNF